MTSIDIVENLCEWVRGFTKSLYYKVPDDEDNDEGYTTKLSRPTVYPFFIPPAEVGDDEAPKVPSVCVQILDTEDSFNGISVGEKTMSIRIVITLWNPGSHYEFTPEEAEEELGGVKYIITDVDYDRNLEGWRELLDLQDVIVRELQKDEIIAGIRADLTSIRYGMFKDDEDSIYLMYPYWAGYVDFTAKLGATRIANAYNDLL